MLDLYGIEANKRALLADLKQLIEEALQPFADDLREFLERVRAGQFGSDWRRGWDTFVETQADAGFNIEADSANRLVQLMESWEQQMPGARASRPTRVAVQAGGHTQHDRAGKVRDVIDAVGATVKHIDYTEFGKRMETGPDVWWAVDAALGVIQVPAEFIAGGGDSLTIGITETVRQWLWGDELSRIQHRTVYRAGEWTEVGVEVLVTGGGALMKRAAAKKIAQEAAEIAARSVSSLTKEAAQAAAGVAKERIANGLRREARELVGASRDEIVHHINTLLGHPPYLARGNVPSEFPTLGIQWLANSKWNLMRIPKNQPGKHILLHQRAYIAEQMLIKATHPVLTGGRAIRNFTRDGGVEVTVSIDCRK